MQNTLEFGRAVERTQTIDDLLRSKHGQTMPVSESLILTMTGLNPQLFSLPGGAILPSDQRAAQYGDFLKYHLVKNEAHAAPAAGAYGLISGTPAFCLLTSGPGIWQGLVGVYNAYMEFEPEVVISGNVFEGPLKNPNNRAFQKAEIIESVQKITKRAILVDDPLKIQEIVKESFLCSAKHPHGPTLIDIPKDVQLKDTKFEYFEPVTLSEEPFIDYSMLERVAGELKSAHRPFVVLGRGAFPARVLAWELIERMGLPFGYTLKGKGVLPDDHPQNYGMIGQHGAIATNQAMENSDFVFIIGCNGDDRAFLTDHFTNGKRALINPYLVNAQERLTIDFPMRSDSRDSLEYILSKLDGTGQHEKLMPWNAQIRKQYESEPAFNPAVEGISPVSFIEELSRLFNPDVIVSDVGEHQMHVAKRFQLKLGGYKGELYGNTPEELRNSFRKRIVTSGTAGTMATAIPYSAGIKIADPSLEILTVIGDGGFEMQPSALWMVRNLDVATVVMNNGMYGQVLEWMRAYHDNQIKHTKTTDSVERGSKTVLVPNLSGFVSAYELPFSHVFQNSMVTQALNDFKKYKGPKVMEAVVSPMGAYPMIPNGKTYRDAQFPK